MVTKKYSQKGKLLEAIVATLHERPGITVEKNVRLLTKGSNNRKREIDVLITSLVAGYRVTFAIECKNHDKSIGAPEIDAFVGKLQDVNIATQLGIYVSANGYTKGAIERAHKSGIRLLTIGGLTSNGVESKLIDVVQSIVYVVPIVETISVASNAPIASETEDISFFDQERNFVGTVPDLIWHRWLNEKIPSALGKHKFELSFPAEWVQVINNRQEKPISIFVEVLIRGYMIAISGKATHHTLINATDSTIEKFQTKVKFETQAGKHPLHTFDSEQDLATFWNNHRESVKLQVGRIRLPRIRMGNIYWPPSQRVIQALDVFMQGQFSEDIDKDKLQRQMQNIEGDDLISIWDPI